MTNPRLATRYAKSLLDLAIEQNNVSAVYEDMKMLKGVIHANQDLVALLKSPIVSADKKQKILLAVFDGKISTLTELFVKLLVNKCRESNLPEIVTAFLKQYNVLNHIHEVKITTAQPLSQEMQETILSKVRSDASIEKIELTTAVENALIGGFTLEMGDVFVDASIQRDLNDVKRQFQSNEYLHNIR
jgi:F-type H+-transporting ATPase subunit delta